MRYSVDADTRSLYIHWPFCPYRCHFCPFVAVTGQDHFMEQYHAALMKEIKLFGQECGRKLPLDTIYLGGGTPSTWPDKLLLDMSGTLRSTFNTQQISEMTIEANPGTVTKDQLKIWKEAGITRLSIGVQSLNDQVLKKLNRHQKAQDVYNLVDWAAGMFDVSIDLIIGLPGVTHNEWKAMIQKIVQWPIQHISMYFLSIHENTPLYQRLKNNELQLPPEDPIVDLYYWTVDMFDKYGLQQYEISSFARVNKESQHNQVYWDRKPYKGFGIGACSFDGKVRYQNIKNMFRYMEALDKGQEVNSTSEVLIPEQVRLETVMLGLRRMKGLVITEAVDGMSPEQKERFFARVDLLEKKEMLKQDAQRIYLAKTVLAVENEVAIKLLQ